MKRIKMVLLRHIPPVMVVLSLFASSTFFYKSQYFLGFLWAGICVIWVINGLTQYDKK